MLSMKKSESEVTDCFRLLIWEVTQEKRIVSNAWYTTIGSSQLGGILSFSYPFLGWAHKKHVHVAFDGSIPCHANIGHDTEL